MTTPKRQRKIPLEIDGVHLDVDTTLDAVVDVKVDDAAFDRAIARREVAIARVYSTLDEVKTDLQRFFPKVTDVMPPSVSGVVFNPDGAPAARVSVRALEPRYTQTSRAAVGWTHPRAVTDDRGAFRLKLPHVPLPEQHDLQLEVRGGQGRAVIDVKRAHWAGEHLGALLLPLPVTPLPRTVVAELRDIVPTTSDAVADDPAGLTTPGPELTIGEGDCAQLFRSNRGVIDVYRYSVLIRLVEPMVGPPQLVFSLDSAGGKKSPQFAIGTFGGGKQGPGNGAAALTLFQQKKLLEKLAIKGKWDFLDRVPIDRAIDVAHFKDQVERAAVDVPKAATLGIGYVVGLRQVWVPAGYSLGDLLYSLPLAPGERQQVAVIERREELAVRETESFLDVEQQRFDELADSSTQATFQSAYKEKQRGGSSMHTESANSGIGFAGGIGGLVGQGVLAGIGVAGGHGSTSSSGSTSSWQKGSRDFVSSATEDFHSALHRTASASRSTNRVGVRLASASDTRSITTKIVANHNHSHALTMQFWEVLRHFGVSSEVDDVQLVAFVPLELIPWLPEAQPRTLPAASPSYYTRDNLLARYEMLLRFHDVLAFHMGRQPAHRHGLALLRSFAANPTITVQDATTGAAVDTVKIEVTGTFLPSEEVFCSLVTKGGQRVGPIRLLGAASSLAADTHDSRDDVLAALRAIRDGETGATRTASLVLPDYVARSDVQRLELTRSFAAFSYRLKFPAGGTFADLVSYARQAVVTLTPARLESEFDGPYVWDVTACIDQPGEPKYVDAYASRQAAERMGAVLQIPAHRVPPILSFHDLLRIESVFQHVVTNTVTYSKYVWASMTPEERAILLERFTIGVPAGGLTDPSQQVPLLNCVANAVIAYFGNAMVMPFYIPPPLAASMKVTSRDVQEALLRFHREAFVPPKSSITLPARGMLGEAVLGHCNSSEKIDLTRFWNWEDSQTPDAFDLEKVPLDKLGTTSLLTKDLATFDKQAGSGNSLVNISTGTNQPAPTADLLSKLMTGGVEKSFTDITGRNDLMTQLTAERTAAEDARQESQADAKQILDGIFKNAAEALKSQKELQAAEKATEEAKTKNLKTAEEEALKQAAAATKAALEKLSTNAASFIALAGAQGDDAKALAKAQGIVKELFGPTLPGDSELAALFGTFKEGSSDDADTKRGKAAFRKALSLP
jgi:hypothetical protein